MTEMTLKLRQYILDLHEFVQSKKAEEGENFAGSTAAKQCFGHGGYYGVLRDWPNDKASPTLDKTLVFERFLMNQLDEKEVDEFNKAQAAKIRAARPASEPAPAGELDW